MGLFALATSENQSIIALCIEGINIYTKKLYNFPWALACQRSLCFEFTWLLPLLRLFLSPSGFNAVAHEVVACLNLQSLAKRKKWLIQHALGKAQQLTKRVLSVLVMMTCICVSIYVNSIYIAHKVVACLNLQNLAKNKLLQHALGKSRQLTKQNVCYVWYSIKVVACLNLQSLAKRKI